MTNRSTSQRSLRPLVWAMACAAFATPGVAQVLYLEPVEAGGEDVNSLRTSLREPQADLRVPMDFDRVFRVRGDSRLLGSRGEEMYARVSNGLVAMFPKSTYVAGSSRTPTLPPGTIWLLGATTRVGEGRESPDGAQSYVMPIDRRVNTEAPVTRAELPPAPSRDQSRDQSRDPIPCLFESESVRRERVGLRLNEAMR